jgi:hypothetical protein
MPWLLLIAAVAVLGAYFGGRAEERLHQAEVRQLAVAKAGLAKELELARAEGKLSEIVQDAKTQTAVALADANRARAESGRLRDAANLAATRAATAARGEAANQSARMLADVLSWADDRAGALAQIADARGAAGAACERAYDALTSTLKK